MEALEILEKFSLFLNAKSDTRAEMITTARLAMFPQGSMYICEGANVDQIALVGSGLIRVYKTSESGRAITLYTVKPGELCRLNLLCVLTGIQAPASAEIEQDVQVVMFPGKDFRRWIGLDNAIRTVVFSEMGQSLIQTMRLVEEIAFKKMDTRLAQYIQSRLVAISSSDCSLSITHEAIASELGSAREVISRLLKEFEQQGAIALGRGRIKVSDQTLLQKIAKGIR
ncbi:MAG: Crp/Fnr family transcriptional regulator [Candidatus Competibacteraceae bacterium]|nr:Crp/Fnr family transcriptional regulator [Candidatus Competibacteraceae bacterium]MCP5126017.1 Crp/Fnr family transcriptional regulator [Gammaproteobacteria bacterium]